MPRIARGCDAVLNVPTGGGLGMTREERLRAAAATSPESLNVGSMNLADRPGWVEPPFFVQMVFGILGGVGADLDNLMHMHTIADKLFGDSYEWSVLAAGRHQMPFATQAVMLGGNVRVGMAGPLPANA